MRDVHFLEIAKQARIDLKTEANLLFVIEGFVRLKERQKDPWEFRIKADGSKYWVNHKEMIAAFTYPYLNDLLKAIESHRKKYSVEKMTVPFKELNALHVLTEISSQPEVYKAARARSISVRKAYLAHGDLPSHAVDQSQDGV